MHAHLLQANWLLVRVTSPGSFAISARAGYRSSPQGDAQVEVTSILNVVVEAGENHREENLAQIGALRLSNKKHCHPSRFLDVQGPCMCLHAQASPAKLDTTALELSLKQQAAAIVEQRYQEIEHYHSQLHGALAEVARIRTAEETRLAQRIAAAQEALDARIADLQQVSYMMNTAAVSRHY